MDIRIYRVHVYHYIQVTWISGYTGYMDIRIYRGRMDFRIYRAEGYIYRLNEYQDIKGAWIS